MHAPGKWLVRHEEGAAVVEMAIALTVLMALMFGIIQMCLMFYCMNFAAEAAREATRYASVRGQNSCSTTSSSFTDCNLGPTTTGNPIQTYVQGLGLPFASGMTASATWWSPTATSAPTWTLACTTLSDGTASPLGAGTGNQCNYPGHAVQVTVSYPFPIQIPFVPASTLTVTSTSMMVINE
jgi:Flp pilus assembly protein TadG